MKPVHKWILAAGFLANALVATASESGLATATVTLQAVPELQLLDGHVDAVNQSTLSAQTSGVIEDLPYDVDDKVSRGSVIARIRSENQRAGVKQAKAGVSEAVAGTRRAAASLSQTEAGMTEAEAGLRQAQAGAQQSLAELQRAQAGLTEAQALRKEAQTAFNRNNELNQRRLIPRADFDRAEAALGSATARVQSAQAQVKSAQAQADSARSQVEAARARVGSATAAVSAAGAALNASKAAEDAASAQVDQAGEQLGYTTLVAPFNWIVTQRHVQLGEAVSPGTPVMSGISLDEMRVLVEVPQRLINSVRQFRQAHVYRDDSGEALTVKSMTIFPYADLETNAFKVRIELAAGQGNLFPGMFVKVAFVLGDVPALLIPKSAVAIRSEVTGVYVLNPNDTISLRQIRLGKRVDDRQVSILAGLSAGERVILDPVAAVITLKKQAAALQEEAQHD